MNELLYVILKVLFDFALEVWFSIYYIRSQTCKCKKGSDWLKRWVEAQHNILSCNVFHDWSIIKLGNILYLLDGSIFAVLFGTPFHCF